MTQQTPDTVDVLVVGGATGGLYVGGLLAKQGYKVLIVDEDKEETLGGVFDIIHIAKTSFAEYGLHEPVPGDEEYVSNFTLNIQKSALNNWPKRSYGNTLVLRRVQMIKRLAAWAREQGAELLCETRFVKPLFDIADEPVPVDEQANNPATSKAQAQNDEPAANTKGSRATLSGGIISTTTDGVTEEKEVKARLVIDASGIPAVVRTQLPDNYGVENFVTGPRDQFYVILHYVDLDDPERDAVKLTTTWTHYKIWLAPQHGSGGAIMGVGANLSFDYAKAVFDRFAKKGFLPEGKVTHLEKGSTPYRRIPYSLVADSFVALGSAACISNPWSGEGVPNGWLEGRIVAEIAGEALKKDAAPTQKDLWPINVRYQPEQGALFAKNLAMLSGATACTEEENDYEYKKGIIYEDKNEDGSSNEKGTMVGKLLKGVITGNISFATVKKLLDSSSIGEKIENHYLAYPVEPDGLAAWVETAEALWAQAGSMADVAEADLASMQE